MPSNSSLYSAWPLIGGALSRAIGESFSGLTAGGIQGEEVRHKRAGEGIQQAYLQQALQQQGLSERRLNAQEAYQQGLLGWHNLQAQIAALKEQREAQQATEERPVKLRHLEAQTASELAKPEQAKATLAEHERHNKEVESGAAEGRKNTAEYRAGQLARQWADIGIRAQKAQAASQKALAGSTALSQQQKLQLAALNMKARDLRQQSAQASQMVQLGQKPRHELAWLDQELAQVEAAIEEMATQAGGGAAGNPAAAFHSKWGSLLGR